MKLFRSRTTTSTRPVPSGAGGDGSGGDGAAGPNAPAAFDLAEMSFLDHLEELRWSLFKGFGGLLVTTALCLLFSDWIIDVVLLGPAKEGFFMYELFGLNASDLQLQNRTITGQFFAFVGTIVAVGFVVGSPIFVYYLWKFIEPGLYPQERAGLRFAAAFATFFFLLGIVFGYLIITPVALQFFAGFQLSPQVDNDFDIMTYFSMVTWWAFGTGILFQLPVAVYFLARLGIATPALLRRSRKFALLIVLVLGALFTPPDPLSQILVAVPLFLLYEGSIYIAVWAERKRQRELEAALAPSGGDTP